MKQSKLKHFIKNNFFYSILIIVFLIIPLISCPESGEESDDTEGGTSSSSSSQINVNTVIWEKDQNGYLQFSTNDSRFVDSDGSTIWKMGQLEINQYDDTFVFEAVCNKLQGTGEGGYGITFCMQDINNFIVVMIRKTGSYCVIKRYLTLNQNTNTLEEKREFIIDWTFTSALIQGNNQNNKIKVSYLGNRTFKITFNDIEENPPITFEENENKTPLFNMGGKLGYLIVISPKEQFPDTPVDVRFFQNIPVDLQFASNKSTLLAKAGLYKQNDLMFFNKSFAIDKEYNDEK